MIDTDVPGDPASVRAAAEWLRSALRGGARAAWRHQADARSAALDRWEGDAADGYRAAASSLLAATAAHADRVGRAALALEEYAARLARLQELMSGLRSRAAAGGLIVTGTTIRAVADRVALYDALATEAGDARAAFSAWSAAHLSAAVADARDTDDVEALIRALGGGLSEVLPDVGLGLTGLGLRDVAARFRADAAEFRRRSRVAGDPRVRGLAETPGGRSHLGDLLRRAKYLGHAGRLTGPLGIGLDVGAAVQEGRETGDWTRVSLTTGASLGTGLAVSVGAASAPAAVVVVGGGLLAYGAGRATGEIYDHRAEIADTAADAWDAVTPW